jgi:hypothetical protein
VTLGGVIVSFFPLCELLLVIAWFIKMFMHPEIYDIAVLIGIVYLLPVALFRIHNAFWPVRDGSQDISEKKYNAWWASHMFQLPFISIPWLEGIIHLVPGLYSMWLRAWGSRIGHRVYWTPKIEIVDRHLIDVGDRVVFGHLVAMCSHMVAPIDGKQMLVLKTIHIGSGAFIGACSKIGPGSVVAPGANLRFKTEIYWRGDWK